MGPSHHCPSYTFDRHLYKARTLADIVFGMTCVGIGYPHRKNIMDAMHATFTIGLHRAYKIHVQKNENSHTARSLAYAHLKVVCWNDYKNRGYKYKVIFLLRRSFRIVV